MPDEPWDSYSRDGLRAGWSYPVGRSIVEASLRAAGVHLLSLRFYTRAGGPPDAGTSLLRAERYADIGNTYHLPRGTPDRSRSWLGLYAVPSALRLQARAALIDGGVLDRACAWLAAAGQANPTWLDKSHGWTARLRDGMPREQETER